MCPHHRLAPLSWSTASSAVLGSCGGGGGGGEGGDGGGGAACTEGRGARFASGAGQDSRCASALRHACGWAPPGPAQGRRPPGPGLARTRQGRLRRAGAAVCLQGRPALQRRAAWRPRQPPARQRAAGRRPRLRRARLRWAAGWPSGWLARRRLLAAARPGPLGLPPASAGCRSRWHRPARLRAQRRRLPVGGEPARVSPARAGALAVPAGRAGAVGAPAPSRSVQRSAAASTAARGTNMPPRACGPRTPLRTAPLPMPPSPTCHHNLRACCQPVCSPFTCAGGSAEACSSHAH
jgi:hypothetical protein